jgi:hypothetical protein
MADKRDRQVLTLSFPNDDKDTIAVYSYLKQHVSTTNLVSNIILPQVRLKALLSSGADEEDIKRAAIASLNFSRQSIIDVLDALALSDIQIPPEILQRFQNSLHSIVSNMPAPSAHAPAIEQPIASPIDQLEIQGETHITANLDDESSSEILEIDSPLFR